MLPDPAMMERFVERVPFSGCWLWIGALVGDGYGKVAWGRAGKKYQARAHRAAYVMANGAIPHGACVLHRCDVPCCVNPAHLFLGSVSDNNADKVAKGRQARGESHTISKLTESAVRDIRSSSLRRRELAEMYGVKPATIKAVRMGLWWRHVDAAS